MNVVVVVAAALLAGCSGRPDYRLEGRYAWSPDAIGRDNEKRLAMWNAYATKGNKAAEFPVRTQEGGTITYRLRISGDNVKYETDETRDNAIPMSDRRRRVYAIRKVDLGYRDARLVFHPLKSADELPEGELIALACTTAEGKTFYF